jgi:hypothetical protein
MAAANMRPFLLLSLALAGCADPGPAAPDPCASLDAAAERHLAAARSRGLSAATLAAHRDAARRALQPVVAPDCALAGVAP